MNRVATTATVRARRASLLRGYGIGGLFQPPARKTGALQAATNVRILAHDPPDEIVAIVFDHRDDRALVDADIVAGDPAEARHEMAALERYVVGKARVERVEESVRRIDLRTELIVHVLDRRYDDFRSERQRSGSGRRRDGAVVERIGESRAACRVVAERARLASVILLRRRWSVARGQSPDVFAVELPAHRIGDRICALRVGRAAAIFEIVESAGAHVGVLDVAEIDPDMGILMPEQRREAEIFLLLERAPGARVALRPRGPCVRADALRWRAEREHIDQHAFVVALPVVGNVAAFRIPAHRDQRRAHLHPRPFDATVDRIGQPAYFGFVLRVLIEVRLREEDAAEQQRGVDRRKLDPVGIARAGLEIEEMVEKSVIAAHAFAARALRRTFEEAQRGERALRRLFARDVTAFDADAVSGQSEADRG